MALLYPERHHFGVVPDELLDDELALQNWLADEAAKDDLAVLLVGLRATHTYDESRVNVIPITVAEGFCFKGERRLPHVTYHDINSEHIELPEE